MPKRNLHGDLTLKERLFLNELAKSKGKMRDSHMKAYGSTNKRAATQGANKIMKRPIVRAAWLKMLERAGLDDKTVADKWNEAVTTGWGVRATHKDALTALTVVSKMKGWNKDASAALNVNIRHEISGKTYDEIKKMHEAQMRKNQDVIQDAEIVS